MKIKFPVSRFIIRDRSMEPAFLEFDRVITLNFGKLQRGSVIVFKRDGKYLIKRVKELKNESLIAFSDNKKLAKQEYKVKSSDVIGRVFLKY